jgi:Ca-activated chloride channel family protein
VQEQASDDYVRIRIEPGERLNRDFILRFRLGGAGIASALTLHPDANAPQEGTFALTIVPPRAPSEAPSRPRDIVFLIDRSGSMEGWKIVAARRAIAGLIETLNDADRFCVLAFDSTVESPTTLP